MPVARSKAFSHVILKFSLAFSFFVEMMSHQVLLIVCFHRYQHAIAINIHKGSKRATARERNEMALVNQIP
jgi:hypothetical protein